MHEKERNVEITADIVKQLRDVTGAGMMDCKKALVQSQGDFEKAIRILKEMGLAAVAKRSGRATNNGRVFILVQDKRAVILELSCETDFVARNEHFIALGNELCNDIIAQGYTTIVPPLEEKVKYLIATLKENMALKRFALYDLADNQTASQYIHDEGSLGALVILESDNPKIFELDRVKEFAFDCAMHVAAYTPRFLRARDVDEQYIKEQTEIFTTQTLSLGKPANVVEGIVRGKLNKHFSEVCFLQQPFVKDDSKTVEQVMDALSKDIKASLSIVSYCYYRAGAED